MDLCWSPQPYFIDKSKVIKAFVRCRHKVIMVSAPQGFLKSTNMCMIANFVDGLSHRSIIERRKSVWKEIGLKIMKDEDTVEAYFGQWPYIHLTFPPCTSPSCAIESMIDIIHKQYDRHKMILIGDRLSSAQRVIFQIYQNFSYESIGVGERKLADALAMLCEMLHTYYLKQVYVFIDNYDFPLLEALAKERPLSNVQPFMAKVLTSLSVSKAVKKVLLNGISTFTGVTGEASNVTVYRFLDDHKFTKYYGFTEEDVMQLANKNRCSLEIIKQILGRHYITSNTGNKLYSPEWLLDFLKHNLIENEIWFEEILQKPVMTMVSMRRRLAPLEQGKCVKAKIMQHSTHRDLLQVNRLLNGSVIDLEDEEVELVTSLLFEFGMFTHAENPGILTCHCVAGDSTRKIRFADTCRMVTSLKNLSL